MAEAITAFPAGDPRNAQYNDNNATLEFQEKTGLAGFDEGLHNQEARTVYQESERERGEPGAYRQNTNRANKGGLLESGINTQRHGTLEAGFAARRTGNQLALTTAQGTAKTGKEHLTSEIGLKKQSNLNTAIGAAYQDTLAKKAESDQITREAAANRVASQAAPAAPPGTYGASENPGQWVNGVRIGYQKPWTGKVRIGGR
jgi:hypothetical protein